MSVIPDDDLERLARLLMGGNETDSLRSKIVRLLQTDDDLCAALHEAHFTAPPFKPWNGYIPS
jgi:hypothetical protein